MKLVSVLLLLLIAGLTLAWFFAPGPMYRAAVAAERQLAGLDTREVKVAGTSWTYSDGGAGEPLLLVHGFGADKDNWSRVARHLTDRYRVIAPDLPGFGDSDAASGDYTIAAQALRLLDFADAVGLQTFHLGGNSMGGYIALAAASQQPDRVATLWLLAPAGVSGAPPSPYFESVLLGRENLLIPATAGQFEQTLELVFERRPYLPGPMVRYLGQRQVARRGLLQTIFNDMGFRSQPAEVFAQGLDIPTLIVWGEEDRVLHPGGAAILSGLLADDFQVTMPGIGHLPMVEDPSASAACYLRWRQLLASRPPDAPKADPTPASGVC